MSLIQNKKVHFNYEIIERYEAGIELFGSEVKALRAGRGSLDGSHVTVRGGEAYLVGATVQPYQSGNIPKDYDATRNRRLLLTKREIAELGAQESKKGLTIVPISVYNKQHKLKVEIAIVRGKKTHDKRETIKKREAERDVMRDLKSLRSEAS
ncbi:MAG: SsrA-binding protein [Parcubacteria group bacterium GW2011_GWC1_42_11]|uniref:SsrA-binding protein n=1 Tax=Candidatus Nomurabacteria bacterium GW2011_GWC2_42_20 TaxID=1618756 RepID=A0A0G0ZFH9_9BACT|nr:MAG: SsrA-binding protein [Parcubacteria group bacterium GW2011_GWC1_42_11]KKS47472.1 MAG: SsrA-binding protein [Candidatus Nomurabacteria bacterium GW2011_GWC2_42_20]KKT09507.1 MAG: SsrA-binding protein [Candidatus Nomurabacteria bacterium GW2011_GWB1_43_20]HBH71343.1 SsrA-binding protein [Candidatus Yonathbacteria bacterium]